MAGIIMGALGGAGEALQNVGSTMFKAEIDKDARTHDSELAVQRAKTLEEFRSQLDLKNIPLKAQAMADADLKTAPTRAQSQSIVSRAAAQDEVDNAPLKGQAKAASEYAPELVEARSKEEEQKQRTKARVEREETIATGNDPQYVAAVRKLSQAKHIEGLGSVRQAELAQLGIDEKKKVAALIERFETATDPAEKARIKESLTVRGIIKPGEFDTERVTTETMNEDGSTTKVERTQRRQGGAAPAAKPKLAVGTEIDGYVFQGGNPKDKANWVAKGRTSGGKVQ